MGEKPSFNLLVAKSSEMKPAGMQRDPTYLYVRGDGKKRCDLRL